MMRSESEDLPLPVFVSVCDVQICNAEREQFQALFLVVPSSPQQMSFLAADFLFSLSIVLSHDR